MPPVALNLTNSSLRDWALGLNQLWLTLGRRVADAVREAPERHSLIAPPHGLIIPGGRFREGYYWDSYWILEGLLACDMASTALGVIENMLDQIRR